MLRHIALAILSRTLLETAHPFLEAAHLIKPAHCTWASSGGAPRVVRRRVLLDSQRKLQTEGPATLQPPSFQQLVHRLSLTSKAARHVPRDLGSARKTSRILMSWRSSAIYIRRSSVPTDALAFAWRMSTTGLVGLVGRRDRTIQRSRNAIPGGPVASRIRLSLRLQAQRIFRPRLQLQQAQQNRLYPRLHAQRCRLQPQL